MPMLPDVPTLYMLKPEIALMKHRLATSELLKEAEAMGFEIEIKLPKDCMVKIFEDARQESYE